MTLRNVLRFLRILVKEIGLASLFMSEGCLNCLLILLNVSNDSNHFHKFSCLFLNLIHCCFLHQKIGIRLFDLLDRKILILLSWLLHKASFAVHHHILLLLIIFAIIFIRLVQNTRLIILQFYKIVIDRLFEFPLLRVDLVLLFSETNSFVSRLWSPDVLWYHKLKVISSLSSKGGLVASLSPKGHSLLMHL